MSDKLCTSCNVRQRVKGRYWCEECERMLGGDPRKPMTVTSVSGSTTMASGAVINVALAEGERLKTDPAGRHYYMYRATEITREALQSISSKLGDK